MIVSNSTGTQPATKEKRSKWRIVFLTTIIVLAGIVAAVIASSIVLRHSWKFGDVPTWILAVATLTALGGAIVATRIAYNLYVLESDRDVKVAEDRRLADEDRMRADEERAESREADRRAQAIADQDRVRADEDRMRADEDRMRADEERAERREADRRAQANKVAAWFGQELVPGAGLKMGATTGNASDLPILDVRIFYYYVEELGGLQWRPIFRGSPHELIRIIPPNSERFREIPEDVRKMIGPVNDEVCVVGIEFSDAEGIRWRRDGRGMLEEMTT